MLTSPVRDHRLDLPTVIKDCAGEDLIGCGRMP
jgi:hypothetical protein